MGKIRTLESGSGAIGFKKPVYMPGRNAGKIGIRAVSLVVAGLVLSGCIATALTPTEDLTSSSFSVNQPAADPQAETASASPDAESVPELPAPGTSYIAVPNFRNAAATDEADSGQLALASPTAPTPAENATSNIANPVAVPRQPATQNANPQPAIEHPVAKKPESKSFFATLFGTKKQPAAPKAAATSEPGGTQLALASPTAPTATENAVNSVATTVAIPKKSPVQKAVSEPVIERPTAKKPESKGFFAALFGTKNQPAAARTNVRNADKPSRKSTRNSGKRRVAIFKPTGKGGLPGVRKLGLFGIYDSREGADEGFGNPVRVASVGGLGRTSANGLRVQRAAVQVACLKPDLVRIIKQVQRRYGKVPVVTSGYRSPSYNRRVRGARNSMHIYCKAADIQVEGVSKWTLAKYLRTIPGRGGVGTYCYNNVVHIDTGVKRDWNWRCRRGKRKRKS